MDSVLACNYCNISCGILSKIWRKTFCANNCLMLCNSSIFDNEGIAIMTGLTNQGQRALMGRFGGV